MWVAEQSARVERQAVIHEAVGEPVFKKFIKKELARKEMKAFYFVVITSIF